MDLAQHDRPWTIGRIGGDFRDAGVGFARDFWGVVSFPSRLDRRGWATVGGVAAVCVALYAADAEIAEATSRQAGHQPHQAIRDIGDFFEPVGLMGNTNVLWLGGIVTGWVTGQEWLRAPARDLLVSHWIAGLTRNPIRDFVGRRRPSDGFGPRTYVRGEGTSFPSGHASTIVQVASILSHHIDRRWASALLYGAAATVVFQRVDDEKHWASDAWIGAAWGWGVARVVTGTDGPAGGSEGPGLALVAGGPTGVGLALRLPLGSR
jgi:membrane-associated phospholipid phosphatase